MSPLTACVGSFVRSDNEDIASGSLSTIVEFIGLLPKAAVHFTCSVTVTLYWQLFDKDTVERKPVDERSMSLLLVAGLAFEKAFNHFNCNIDAIPGTWSTVALGSIILHKLSKCFEGNDLIVGTGVPELKLILEAAGKSSPDSVKVLVKRIGEIAAVTDVHISGDFFTTLVKLEAYSNKRCGTGDNSGGEKKKGARNGGCSEQTEHDRGHKKRRTCPSPESSWNNRDSDRRGERRADERHSSHRRSSQRSSREETSNRAGRHSEDDWRRTTDREQRDEDPERRRQSQGAYRARYR